MTVYSEGEQYINVSKPFRHLVSNISYGKASSVILHGSDGTRSELPDTSAFLNKPHITIF